MGGEHSGVSATTRDVFLESAFFDQIAIAGKACSYGLHTDASHRYERGVDWKLAREAMERATGLLLEITGGEAGPITETVSEQYLPSIAPITLRAKSVEQMLGLVIEPAEIEQLLSALGLGISAGGKGSGRLQYLAIASTSAWKST